MGFYTIRVFWQLLVSGSFCLEKTCLALQRPLECGSGR
ncbi:hypothetical protein HAT2_00662 [Candidatus Similichlamydia laticola]|uniref:Uncharacterized protein n=1 Tax=Candidatus Similichlamydia laticola TaxID=2170265 RepID=A0A369KC59_9BACT|nr:hypothetical protein HAT2_00662 [Candidatus Similichlamydia laticola]